MRLKSMMLSGVLSLTSALAQPLSNLEKVIETQSMVEEKDAIHTVVHIRQKHFNEFNYQLNAKAKENLAQSIKLYEQIKKFAPNEFTKVEPTLKKTIKTYEDILKNNIISLVEVNNDQKEIYEICSKLLNAGVVSRIYQEGVLETKGESPFLIKKENAEEYLIEFREQFTQVYSMPSEKYYSNFRFVPGGPIRLAYEKEAEIYVCDASFEELGISRDIKEEDKSKRILNERREDITLQNLINHDTNELISIIVYGAAHDFSNNVIDWNKKHPDKKVNLRVYSPESLGEEKNAHLN